MNPTSPVILEEALKAAKTLPEDVQKALAEELLALVEDYRASGLTARQREIIRRRLKASRAYVPRADFLAMLRKYSPNQ